MSAWAGLVRQLDKKCLEKKEKQICTGTTTNNWHNYRREKNWNERVCKSNWNYVSNHLLYNNKYFIISKTIANSSTFQKKKYKRQKKNHLFPFSGGTRVFQKKKLSLFVRST